MVRMARVLPEEKTGEMKEDMDEKESEEADVVPEAGGEREVEIVDIEAGRGGDEGLVRGAAAGVNVVAAGDVAVGHHDNKFPRHVRACKPSLTKFGWIFYVSHGERL